MLPCVYFPAARSILWLEVAGLSSNEYQEDEELENENPTEYTPKRNSTGKRPSSGKKGFYIALAVCLVAVGVAGWTTYDSLHQYKKASVNTIQTITTGSEAQKPTQSAVSVAPAPAESAKESKAASKPASSAAAAKKTVPAAAVVSKLRLPVKDAAVQQAFSETPLYSKTMRDWRAHTGVDLSAKKGAEVTAAADGTVQSVTTIDSMGCTVQISHSGSLETWYCGLGNVAVKKGDVVKAGQKLGTVDTVPSEAAENAHLHFAVQKNGAFVDPAVLLK